MDFIQQSGEACPERRNPCILSMLAPESRRPPPTGLPQIPAAASLVARHLLRLHHARAVAGLDGEDFVVRVEYRTSFRMKLLASFENGRV